MGKCKKVTWSFQYFTVMKYILLCQLGLFWYVPSSPSISKHFELDTQAKGPSDFLLIVKARRTVPWHCDITALNLCLVSHVSFYGLPTKRSLFVQWIKHVMIHVQCNSFLSEEYGFSYEHMKAMIM